MKKIILIIFILLIASIAYSDDNIRWIKANEIGILGRANIFDGYHRFTNNDLEALRKENENLYWLARHSAGLHVDFTTNSRNIWIKYDLATVDIMPHMPLTGSSGVDAYIRINNNWRYFATILPNKSNVSTTNHILNRDSTSTLTASKYDFSINFPLYNEVVNFEIGIDKNAEIKAISYSDKKPIVIYGSSITQGGCASRPGMAYTNMVRRAINYDVYNLGFSGSGCLENGVSNILANYDSKIMVMDCIANMNISYLKERFIYFYNTFRKIHKTTPIVFIEQPTFTNSYLYSNDIDPKNAELRKLFKEWNKTDKNIYYIRTDELYGSDFEASVDAIHATDLGFMRMSKPIISKLKEILKK